MTAAEYLAQPCPGSFPPIYKWECEICRAEEADELLALRERAAQWDAKAPGLARTTNDLRETLREFALARVKRDDGAIVTIQVAHEIMAEARRLTR